MSKQLVLELPEDVYEQLQKVAQSAGQSLEDWVKKRLELDQFKKNEKEAIDTMGRDFSTVTEETDDPLLKLAGTLSSEFDDISEHHDDYIGTALLKSIRSEWIDD